MTLLDQLRRMERLDYLIRSRATGTPSQLADKLDMSVSQLFCFLRLIREKLDAPIYYNKSVQSYCYEKEVKFTFGYLPEREVETVIGNL